MVCVSFILYIYVWCVSKITDRWCFKLVVGVFPTDFI